MCVAAIQETKWFGKDGWPAIDDCMFLHLDHYLPERDAFAHRGEDFEIFLYSMASEAQRHTGEV